MAVDRHIRRMREFARNLENTPENEPTADGAGAAPGARGSSRFIRGKASGAGSKRIEAKSAQDKKSLPASKRGGGAVLPNAKSDQKSAAKDHVPPNSDRFWREIESDLDFIDEDENVVIRSEAERELIEAKSRLNSPSRDVSDQPMLGLDQDQDHEAFTRCSSQITTPVRTRNKQLRDIVAVLDKYEIFHKRILIFSTHLEWVREGGKGTVFDKH